MKPNLERHDRTNKGRVQAVRLLILFNPCFIRVQSVAANSSSQEEPPCEDAKRERATCRRNARDWQDPTETRNTIT